MWKIIFVGLMIAAATGLPTKEDQIIFHNGSTQGAHYEVSRLENGTTTLETDSTTLPPSTTPGLAKKIELCNQTICEEKICRVNGSISRPSFYARCPTLLENDVDLTQYCMCASAYHAAPEVTSTGETRPSYIQITPDVNCDVPISDLEKNFCEQDKCQTMSKKSNRLAHICQVEDKYYCACFN